MPDKPDKEPTILLKGEIIWNGESDVSRQILFDPHNSETPFSFSINETPSFIHSKSHKSQYYLSPPSNDPDETQLKWSGEGFTFFNDLGQGYSVNPNHENGYILYDKQGQGYCVDPNIKSSTPYYLQELDKDHGGEYTYDKAFGNNPVGTPYQRREHLQSGMENYLESKNQKLEDGWYIANNYVPEFDDIPFVGKGPEHAAKTSEDWAKNRHGSFTPAAIAHSNLVRIEGGEVTHVEGFYNNPDEAWFGEMNSPSSENSGTYPKLNETIVYAEQIENVDDESMVYAINDARDGRFETGVENKKSRIGGEILKGYYLGGNQCQDFVVYVEKKAQEYYKNKYDVNKDGVVTPEEKELVDATDGILITIRKEKSKKERAEERKKLIDDGRNKIDDLEGKEKEELKKAVERLERNNEAVEGIRMSDNIYLDKTKLKELKEQLKEKEKQLNKEKNWLKPGKSDREKELDQEVKDLKEQIKIAEANLPEKENTVEGYQRGSAYQPENLPEELRPDTLNKKNVVWEDPAYKGGSGFRAALYRSEFDDKVYLTFQGTNEIADHLKANAPQGFGFKTEQYEQAIALAKEVDEWAKENGYDLIITGHSLAGGLAQAAGIVTGNRTYTFNAAGPHEATLKRHDKSREDANGLVDNYFAKGEILTTLQSPLTKAQITVIAGLINPNLGLTVGTLLFANGNVPASTGEMHELISDKVSQVDKHNDLKGMEDEIEKQKKEDMETIEKYKYPRVSSKTYLA